MQVALFNLVITVEEMLFLTYLLVSFVHLTISETYFGNLNCFVQKFYEASRGRQSVVNESISTSKCLKLPAFYATREQQEKYEMIEC